MRVIWRNGRWSWCLVDRISELGVRGNKGGVLWLIVGIVRQIPLDGTNKHHGGRHRSRLAIFVVLPL